MDPVMARHYERLRHLRESFAEANERLVARLRTADDEVAARPPAAGGWSAAQIGWHVARVTTQFAGLMSGDVAGSRPLPPDFREREWKEITAGIPERLKAPESAHPPPAVTRLDAIAALEASGMRMARAFDALTPERGAAHGINSPIVGGPINLYQVAEWATAHVIRHNKQAKQAIGA
jgi:hypothetical protein